MANIVLFEDHPPSIARVEEALRNEHQITANATRLSEAFAALRRITNQELDADVLILDGTLERDEEPACLVLPARPRKGLLAHLRPNPPTIIERDNLLGGADARAILKAMGALGLDIPVIGFSADALGPQIFDSRDFDRLTFDLTKGAQPDALRQAVNSLVTRGNSPD